MSKTINAGQVKAAFQRAAKALQANYDLLTELDQALGDGDLGITANKVAETLLAHVEIAEPDLGKMLAQGGMAVNRAASSTMGTLIATALMRAGKEVRGKESLQPADLARMLQMADLGIQERGKAHLGDKTVIDVIHPASEAFAAALAEGAALTEAGARMAAAARAGRDRVTPLRNRVGRASWQGERTEGKPDPGCTLAMVVLEAIAGVGE
jgi:dihydroxyacetone kinase